MAYVQGAWASTTVNGRLILKCTITSTSSETDCCTLKTPANTLDPTRPWTLIVNAASTDTSDQTDLVDIWAGYSSDFTLTSEGSTCSATSGYEVGSDTITGVSDDIGVVVVDPNFVGTKVQGNAGTPVAGHINVGTAPCYAFNVDGGGARKAADTIFYVIQ